MSSDEELCVVSEDKNTSTESLEQIRTSISNYKKKHEQLIQEQRELAAVRDDQREMAKKFKLRTNKLIQDLKVDRRTHEEEIAKEKANVISMKEKEGDLLEEILRVKEALKREEAVTGHLQHQANLSTAVPERPVAFRGSTGLAEDTFEMKSRVVYPMEGGTVLVTFEEEVVANKILDISKHRVDLGSDFIITVEARPVQLMLPKLVEIDTEVSPQHILISNLPKMDTEMLLSRLEIHFSKSKHGGGEVDRCELLPDSQNVVISFVEKHIARRLTEKEIHEVPLPQKMHKVRVTPFLNGTITNLQTKMKVCSRTVLLTGIPDIMERQDLQDLLEIHFQKRSNGGGEVEAFLYNPLGHHAAAVFEAAESDSDVPSHPVP